MKNTILLLATSLLLISSTFVFGQNKVYSQNSSNHNQVDLFSAEILSLINLKMKETNLFNISEKSVLGVGNLNGITSTNLNRSMINTAVFNDIFSSKANRSFEFTTSLKSNNNWNSQYSIFNSNICQNSSDANCQSQSIMHSGNTNERIKLDSKDWNSDKKMQYQAKDFNIRDWNFNIGPIQE